MEQPDARNSPPLRCRGGGATPPASPGSPTDAASELEVAAEIRQLLRRTRKRKVEILEHESVSALEATLLGDEMTSWERDAAPSPSSWNVAPANDTDDEPDVSDPLAGEEPFGDEPWPRRPQPPPPPLQQRKRQPPLPLASERAHPQGNDSGPT